MLNLPPIDKFLAWSKPREVPTANGPRILRKAKPNPLFWKFWSLNPTEMKAALKRENISFSTDLRTNKPVLCWWQPLDQVTASERAANLELSRKASSVFNPPAPLGLEYFPFQRAGIEFAKDKPGCLIADDMGLGKTIQAIGVINCNPDIERVLVVTKTSLKENWRRELSKWLVRPVPNGTIGIAKAQHWPKEASIVVANYDVLVNHHNSLRANPWDLVILDEVQYIKNRLTKRAIAVIGFKPTLKAQHAGEPVILPIPAKRRLALSGTPIENRTAEIWTALHYLDPVRWGSYWSFASTYCDGHKGNFGFDASGASNLGQLQEVLRSTIMIRRLKKDVMKELPPKTRMIIEMDTTGLERFIKQEQITFASYENDLAEAQAALELAKTNEDDARYRSSVVEMANVKWKFNELAKVRHDTAVAKVPQMIDLLHEELDSCSKVLFFAHHHDVLEPMHKAFPGSVLITGDTRDRQSRCDKFQEDPECRILFGSTRACGEGLNLTAANLVVIGEEDWEPAKINQVEDRAHRIGQTDNVFVKHYIVPGTIDARMIKVNMAKQLLIDQALNDPTEAEAPIFSPHEPLGRRKAILDEGLQLLGGEIAAIHRGLKTLWNKADGICLDKVDFGIGRKLAVKGWLTPGEAALGKRLCGRYRSSLDPELLLAMGWRVPMQAIPMDEDDDDVPM